MDRRIYSITFNHDGAEWTATVGETLSGTARSIKRSRRGKIERRVPLSDPATVIAIFDAPVFFMVVTDDHNPRDVRSSWVNPFLAGQPKSVTYFSQHA